MFILLFFILIWKTCLFHSILLSVFLMDLCIKFPFTAGLLIIWLIFDISLGVAVLARVINRYSYLLLSGIMYFIVYIYYAIYSNCFDKKRELLLYWIKTLFFILKRPKRAKNNFYKDLLRTIDYLINNIFIILTLFLLFLYLDAYLHSDNKLTLMLYNQVKGRNYHWWEPDSWWEI